MPNVRSNRKPKSATATGRKSRDTRQRKVAPTKGYTRKKFAGSKRSVLLPNSHPGLKPNRSGTPRTTPKPSRSGGSPLGLPFHPGSLIISSAEKIRKATQGN